MIIQEDTTSYFIQDKQYVLEYLKGRKLNNRELNRIIRDNPFGLLSEAVFSVNGEEYEISHFLTRSDIAGYDIVKVNGLLNTQDTPFVVFAVVLGDDVLCFDTETRQVFLWKIQTGSGEKLLVSKSLTNFIKEIQ